MNDYETMRAIVKSIWTIANPTYVGKHVSVQWPVTQSGSIVIVDTNNNLSGVQLQNINTKMQELRELMYDYADGLKFKCMVGTTVSYTPPGPPQAPPVLDPGTQLPIDYFPPTTPSTEDYEYVV